MTDRYLELSFDKGFENEVLESYLPDIVERSERIQNDNNVVKLYTRDNGYRGSVRQDRDGHWIYVILKHPITLEKLAIWMIWTGFVEGRTYMRMLARHGSVGICFMAHRVPANQA